MSNKKIYYANVCDTNPEIIRQSKLEDNAYVYMRCPVVNHRMNRTFVVTSGIDFYLEYAKENHTMFSSHPNFVRFHEENLISLNPISQLFFSRFLFWTNEKNVWMEFFDHPMTSLKNNFVVIGGWFNLSNWPRNTNIAIKIIDKHRPVIIEKGDPLFRISFHSENFNNGIILEKETNENKIKKIFSQHKDLKEDTLEKKNLLHKLFGKTEVKKCPFRFLYR